VIAWNQKERRVRASMSLECFCKPLPEVYSWLRIVEDITDAEHRIYRVASRDV
jgi:hypothetical protein